MSAFNEQESSIEVYLPERMPPEAKRRIVQGFSVIEAILDAKFNSGDFGRASLEIVFEKGIPSVVSADDRVRIV